MSKGRMEAFSDGVIAIIITIMVLELKIPHGMNFNSLVPLIPKFLSYLLRFIFGPWTWGYFPTSGAAFHQWVHNGKPTQIIRNHIGYLRRDPELRARKIREWNAPVWWPIPLIAVVLFAGVVPAWFAWRRRERETAGRTLAHEGAGS